MKIYAISGLGADKRAFQYLKLKYEMHVIDWIPPLESESLKNYALRLSEYIDQREEYILIGLSFGGMIATEIAKKHNPSLTILLSSAEIKNDLPKMYQRAAKTKFYKYMPNGKPLIPRFMIHHMFGTKNKKVLNEILKESDPNFTKWAIGAMMQWDNTERLQNRIKISGTKDKILPPSDLENTILIEGGRHFMVVDMATRISKIINSEIDKIEALKSRYELDKND